MSRPDILARLKCYRRVLVLQRAQSSDSAELHTRESGRSFNRLAILRQPRYPAAAARLTSNITRAEHRYHSVPVCVSST